MFYMLISMIIVTLMNMIFLLSKSMFKKKEKLFSFECGFNPYLSPRSPFSIQFFKIILIFLLFDVEIVLILPIPLFQAMNFNLFMMSIVCSSILIIGLYFEWAEGSLNWLR